ncbi:MAG: chemotaxis protein CheW, partial [Desulfohalobiaceae bacterium]|nr:chemotaxis protein CheW [Desulfohalobiaceae bacterium]
MTGRQDPMQIATFSIGPSCYGLDICLIREINTWDGITPAPLCREYVQGVINLRGDIVTVIDLGRRLGITAAETDRRAGYTV